MMTRMRIRGLAFSPPIPANTQRSAAGRAPRDRFSFVDSRFSPRSTTPLVASCGKTAVSTISICDLVNAEIESVLYKRLTNSINILSRVRESVSARRSLLEEKASRASRSDMGMNVPNINAAGGSES